MKWTTSSLGTDFTNFETSTNTEPASTGQSTLLSLTDTPTGTDGSNVPTISGPSVTPTESESGQPETSLSAGSSGTGETSGISSQLTQPTLGTTSINPTVVTTGTDGETIVMSTSPSQIVSTESAGHTITIPLSETTAGTIPTSALSEDSGTNSEITEQHSSTGVSETTTSRSAVVTTNSDGQITTILPSDETSLGTTTETEVSVTNSNGQATTTLSSAETLHDTTTGGNKRQQVAMTMKVQLYLQQQLLWVIRKLKRARVRLVKDLMRLVCLPHKVLELRYQTMIRLQQTLLLLSLTVKSRLSDPLKLQNRYRQRPVPQTAMLRTLQQVVIQLPHLARMNQSLHPFLQLV